PAPTSAATPADQTPAPATAPADHAPAPVYLPKVPPQRPLSPDSRQQTGVLEYTDYHCRQPLRILVEEDILVPDTKPDLMELLSTAAWPELTETRFFSGSSGLNSLKLSGVLLLQLLYVGQTRQGQESISSLETKLSFRDEIPLRTEPGSELTVSARLESIDSSIVNERKLRVKAVVLLDVREYRKHQWEFFESLDGEDIQTLKETVSFTNLFFRKTESSEIEEEWKLKEAFPEIGEILSYRASVVENHKQITPEKAIISCTLYCDVLYLPAAENEGEDSASLPPVFVQEKADFTQFIPLEGQELPEPLLGLASVVLSNVRVEAAEEENGARDLLKLTGDVETTLELFEAREQEVSTDAYHNRQEVQTETAAETVERLAGAGTAEQTARSIIEVPQKYGGAEQVLSVTGYPLVESVSAEPAKVVVEGKVPVEVVCLSAEEDQPPFSLKQDIAFRSSVDIPEAESGMSAGAQVSLKELWFDKINNRQIEVNAALKVAAQVCSSESHSMITGVSLLPLTEEGGKSPSMILYVVQPGDSLWKIAKKFRTTVDALREINELGASDLI
ncbi:MAG: DUF3794 domain-containing protein, partial [Bacillota bacterium]|nr:DUF3794 domain-containing protein [Bacillota bacterium]